MKSILSLSLLFWGYTLVSFAQVKIGENPTQINPYALLELNSSTQGLLLPRMSLKQRENSFTDKSPVGLMIYNTTYQRIEIYRGLQIGWESIGFISEIPPVSKLDLVSNTLRLLPQGSTVDLSPFNQKNEPQNLRLENFDLSIDEGNSVSLAHIRDPNTDHQTLQLQGTALSIERGNTVDLSRLSSTTVQSLTYHQGDLSLSGANSVRIPEPVFSNNNNVVTNQTLEQQDFVFGSTQLDNIIGLEDNARFFFDKSKGAFRAGQSSTSEWDATNLGDKSITLGYRSRAKGDRTFAVGDQARADADWSIAIGDEAHAFGDFSQAIGNEVIAESFKEIVLGTNNTHPTGSDDSWIASDRLLSIGNGTSSRELSDALIILKNGTTEINGTFILDPQNNDQDGYSFPSRRGDQNAFLALDASTGITSWTSDLVLAASYIWRLIGVHSTHNYASQLRITAADREAPEISVAARMDLFGNDHPQSGGDLHLATGGVSGTISMATSQTTRILIDPQGRLGIGTLSPTYRVDVAGAIHAENGYFQSGQQLTVPDYVFEAYVNGSSKTSPNYQRPTLEEVEDFIRKYQYLKGSQNRASVAATGKLNLSQQVLFLWEKLEELYVYMFELNRQLKELQSQLKDKPIEVSKVFEPMESTRL